MKGINQARGHSHLLFVQIVRTSFFHDPPLIRATRAEVDTRAEQSSARTTSLPNAAQLIPKPVIEISSAHVSLLWGEKNNKTKQEKLMGEGPVSGPEGR